MSQELLERLQALNPETIEQVTPDELAAVFATIEQRMTVLDEPLMDLGPQPQPRIPPTRRWRGPAIAAAAMVIAVLIAVPLVLTGGNGEPSAAPETPAAIVGVQGMEASVGSLWVRGGDEIWRYTDGAWSAYPSLAGSTYSVRWDVASVGDTHWTLSYVGVFSFDGGDWVELAAAPARARSLDAAPDSETLWLSTGEDLFRWDGEEMTNVGHPSNWPESGDGDGYVGDIVVTEDGSVWAGGLYGYLPSWGGLARYDDSTSSWEAVRPAGADQDTPAAAMATTPGGDLWVLLADWIQDSERREAAGEPTGVMTLAHRDGDTGEWTVYEEGQPEGFPFAMAADDDAVWLAQGSSWPAGFEPIEGLIRFDGEIWTHYLEGTPAGDSVEDIAVAPDGTVWYILNGVLYQLDEE